MNEESKLKKSGIERLSKTLFSAICGAALLIAGLCIGVRAYANYLDSKTYYQDLPNSPARHRGTLDEAVLSGTASLICLSGAGFLFVRAVRIKRHRKRY